MAGKGDTYRAVNQKKYERNYLRVFGKLCPKCKGAGCLDCKGIGRVECK